MADNGRPLPKFGEWDVNDPASAEGFTVIFNKARNEKRTGGKPESPPKNVPSDGNGDETLGKNQAVCAGKRVSFCRDAKHFAPLVPLIIPEDWRALGWSKP